MLGYIGLATPSFLLALILLFYSNRWFGISIGGLYDPAYSGQPWSWGKMQSLASHLVVPTLVIGLGGTAGMIRRLRANLLDELQKQYVVTAAPRACRPAQALLQVSAAHVAQPFIADIGSLLPDRRSRARSWSRCVLSLPTTGPMLLAALKSQDMYPRRLLPDVPRDADRVGMLISDLALAVLDPRIRLRRALGVNATTPMPRRSALRRHGSRSIPAAPSR